MSDANLRQTDLHAVHVAAGAKMVPFGGWSMPVQYASILDEAKRVREHTGLFDLGHMGRLEVKGKDAVPFLDRLVTSFVGKIPVSAIRYGLVCNADGNPFDDLLLYKTSPEDVFVVANASNKDTVLKWLRDHQDGADVTIEDRSDELAMLALQGPKSQAALQPLVEGKDLGDIGYYKFAFATVAGIDNVRVSRTGYTGEDGFELYFPAGEAVRVWGELLEAGKDEGLAPIGLGARDTLRLEAGMPLYGHEIDLDHNPIEAGLNFGISFKEEKGDWIGRDALARIKEAPKRKLVGIKTEGKRVPRQGYRLFRGDEEVGAVCSGAVSPTLDLNIGSAYVPVALADPGQAIDMDIRGKRQACTVCELPFYSRTRK
ncbi:MAG: glycine cleavage system aminomethyltransferase GcvT [Planctomycetota bacterium]